ncbi:MAG: hypothetical protein LBJ00_18395 [Planctomycetaceae bacterium]|nr:hypothetical protein [Planctomycetaceae bacterium]
MRLLKGKAYRLTGYGITPKNKKSRNGNWKCGTTKRHPAIILLVDFLSRKAREGRKSRKGGFKTVL